MLLFITGWLNAQTVTVQGNVTDATDNSPLPGVNVVLKGTTQGTITDVDGNYSIKAEMGETIVFSFIGMDPKEVVVNRSHIDVIMQPSDISLEQVVVVGYGTQKRSDLTGSVAVIDAEEMQKYTTNDMSQMLQGRSPGVLVTSDGHPGAAPNVRIRGYSTFGDAQPLYVIDGVPVGTSPRDFNPNDIESIQVLKDASAGAIYGSRAANGVVIITTKQGKKTLPLK
jgi:TonB-dependent SusC/RagA subfamily outer membrane receptor